MRRLTPEWLTRADSDLGTARREQEPNPEAAAYHAQQCAEKCLKAYLQEQGTPPPRTHDLRAIAGTHPELERALGAHGEALRVPTEYEAQTRYPPGMWVTLEQAQQAVRLADEIRAIVFGLLGADPAVPWDARPGAGEGTRSPASG